MWNIISRSGKEVSPMGQDEIQYSAWGRCIRLSNREAELLVTLDYGPRVIRFGMKNKPNMLFENTAHYPENTPKDEFFLRGGHRLWVSPETEAYTYYPDNDPVKYEVFENGVSVTPPLEANGIQKSIEITMSPNENHVTLRHHIKNCGIWPIEISAWSITMMSPGGLEIVPQPDRETGYLNNRTLSLWPYSKMNDPCVYWGERYIAIRQTSGQNERFKVGLPNEKGWGAYLNHDCLFIKRFTHQPEAVYPDGNVSFETYTRREFTELETLSPLSKISPGGEIVHTEEWQLFGNVPMPKMDENAWTELLTSYL